MALSPGAKLAFPGMECIIENEMGRGSNAIVYCGWYADALNPRQRHRVLIKELFPYHEKGAICRGGDGYDVVCSEEGQATLALHTQSFVWGNQVHLTLRERHPSGVGGNLNTFPLNHTYYSILDFSGGRDLKSELNQRSVSFRQTVQRILSVLDSLSIFHEMGYLHLDISPDNILITDGGAKERIELIDFNSVVDMRDLASGQDVRFSAKPGFASPEVRMQSLPAMGTWTDLYSVSAVFFYAIMGRTLDRMEQSGVKAIDLNACAMLSSMPETVKSMTRQILVRGLAPVAKRRYDSVEGMRTDLMELLDRIDGVGVTHWALWEMSRQAISREIRINPALSYLTKESDLYPIEVGMPEGCSMEAFLAGRGHAQMTGSGGMGKTTLMMRTVWEESRKYRRDRTAVLYLSLYNYPLGDTHFIHDSILRRMKFKSDTESYATARHALDVLLQRPLRTRSGERPVLCLMLDGYNEIAGDTQALQTEINQLAAMDGVRVLLSSRSAAEEFPYEIWEMQPLANETVSGVLSHSHLLMPDSDEMKALLSNPMMLSMFVHACRDTGEQLAIQSREDLIDAYLDALLSKEVRSLPQNAPDRWLVEAAIECVYPLIADWEKRSRSHQTSLDLLSELNRLYDALSSRAFLKRFPAYVGHITDVRGNAKDGEEWYGLVIHDLLWRRLGLVRQDENGVYRMAHQELREALCQKGKPIRELATRRKRRRTALLAGLCALVLITLGVGVGNLLKPDVPKGPDPYPQKEAGEVVETTFGILYQGYYFCDWMLAALDDIESNPDATVFNYPPGANLTPLSFYSVSVSNIDYSDDLIRSASFRLSALTDAYGTELVMPWSGQRLNVDSCNGMMELLAQQSQRYLTYAGVINQMLAYPEYYQRFGAEFVQNLRKAVLADLRLMNWYYYDVVDPELESMRKQDPAFYQSTVNGLSLPSALLTRVASPALDERDAAWEAVEFSPPAERYLAIW